MFPNLNAEQARKGHTNVTTAQMLGLSRTSFEKKKKNGRFTVDEARKLCDIYDSTFGYLFATEPVAHT